MFWNNRGRTNRLFLWGIIGGVIVGLYAARWMIQSFSQERENHSMKQKETRANQPQSTPNLEQAIHNMNQSQKEELFDTFLNGSEIDISEKAKEMN